jgi:hypothetical protein
MNLNSRCASKNAGARHHTSSTKPKQGRATGKMALISCLTLTGAVQTAWAGRIFITGHDPDCHAAYEPAAAAVFLKSGVDYARNGNPLPMLFVESTSGWECRGKDGMAAAGYVEGTDFIWKDVVELLKMTQDDWNNLSKAYSAIVTASDYGGALRKAENDVLLTHKTEIAAFVNAGGGIHAGSQNGRLGIPEADRYGHLPITVVSQATASPPYVSTTFGASIGVYTEDIQAPSHSNFGFDTYGLQVVTQTSALFTDPKDGVSKPQIMSLAGDVSIIVDPIGGGGDFDNDKDSLGNKYEISIGTDPNTADSDGDGINDGDEVAAGSSPTNPSDFPVTDAVMTITGRKYYDTNANGVYDAGEEWTTAAGRPPVTINITATGVGGNTGSTVTDANGLWSFALTVPSGGTVDFTAYETLPTGYVQTGPLSGATLTHDAADAEASSSARWLGTVTAVSGLSGLNFGNVSLGAGGGTGSGFWGAKNGQAVMYDGNSYVSEINGLNALSLRDAAGADQTWVTTGLGGLNGYTAYNIWSKSATATNMAYMLSVQVAAMWLNLEAGYVRSSAMVYAPGCGNAGLNHAFISIADLMAAAETSLRTNGNTKAASATRTDQERLKNVLETTNNNLNFVQ